MNTTQDALSGTGYNVYSFALMFRPTGLQKYIYLYYNHINEVEIASGKMVIHQNFEQ